MMTINLVRYVADIVGKTIGNNPLFWSCTKKIRLFHYSTVRFEWL